MSRALSYATQSGDQTSIHHINYIFGRVDPDMQVFYRAPSGANYGDFMVKGENGHFRRPTVEEMNKLHAKNQIRIRSANRQSEQRRIAREMQLQAAQVKKKDKVAPFREAITRYYDEHQHHYSHSEADLNSMVGQAIKDPKIKKLQPANGWLPKGRTVLDWINDRGSPGKRKARDFMSMTGRMPRMNKLPHPPEIYLYRLLESLTTSGQPNILAIHDKYVDDIDAINTGRPLGRKRLEQDADGRWFPSEKDAKYDVPATPYRAVHATTFWRHHNSEKTANLFGVAVNQGAKRAKYGGGGFGERPPFGAVCEIDDTPGNAWFLVDEETGIGLGTAVFTLMIEKTTTAYVGWDLTGEHASSNSFLRTVRHANFGKEVPEDLLDICPYLGDIRMRPTWLHTDNAAFAHSFDVEAACADAYISLKYMGSKTPTDKSKVERELGTAATTFFGMLPARTFDIELMRRWGFDPTTQQMIGIREAREHLDRYCHTRNLEKRDSLGKRAPAQMFRKHALENPPNVIEDIDEFDIALGNEEQDVAVYATGIDLKFGHYTCEKMGEIAAAFERMHELSAGDVSPKQERRDSNPKRKLKALGRVKYDPDNIGVANLWVPEKGNERWEKLINSNPDKHGMAEFVHTQCAVLAKKEGLDFITDEQQKAVRGRLFKSMEDTTEVSSMKRRKLLGRALDHDHTAKSFKRFVEYGPESLNDNDDAIEAASEDAEAKGAVNEIDGGDSETGGPDTAAGVNEDEHPFAETVPTASSSMATRHRKDAHIRTPRPSTKPTKPRSYGERHRAKVRKDTGRKHGSDPHTRTLKPRKVATQNPRRKYNRLKIGDIK